MNNNTEYIQFDQDKLNSIGFRNSTIIELLEKFSEYLSSIECEYVQIKIEGIQREDISKILHKLEGSMQYLAMTGPIRYIYEIKVSLELDSSDSLQESIDNLFSIIHQTLEKLTIQYRD